MIDSTKSELGALWNIVTLLADGEFHSGEDLGGILGVSRAAVWKHLQKLERFGVGLSSAKGRGYRIQGGLDLLDAEKIKGNLTSKEDLDLRVFAQLDSTNSFLMREQNPSRKICLAEFQSAGRGRRGRVWVSPLAQNIYCSIGWEFDGGVAALEGLSLAIGVAVARTLQIAGVNDVTLKWPNDVLHQNKKLAGILIEVMGDPVGCCQVVVGVGLNVAMQHSQIIDIDQPWTALNSLLAKEAKPIMERNYLAAAMIDNLIAILTDYHQTGFARYHSEWMQKAAYFGDRVVLRNGQQTVTGRFSGVSSTGALCLETDLGEQTFHGGELSLRSLS